MRVGITGHQRRAGIDWKWVASAFDEQLSRRPEISRAFSSLAEGADQVFARSALKRGISLVAVVPVENYEKFFREDALDNYNALIGTSERIDLSLPGDHEAAFLAAGQYIVAHVDILFALWDGAAAAGKGGTGDIVQYALSRSVPVVHINPISRQVQNLLVR